MTSSGGPVSQQYKTPTPDQQPTGDVVTADWQVDPQLGGNAYAQDLLLCSGGSGVDDDAGFQPTPSPGCVSHPANPDYPSFNLDPSLDPLRKALNDDCLSFEDRAKLMVQYRDAQMDGLGDGINALAGMQDYDPANPLTLAGDKRGLHHNLYGKLADDPKMQQMMTDLADRVASGDPSALDIDAIYADTQAKAHELAGEGEDPSTTNLRALQAMATLANFNKFGKDLPPEVAAKLPEGLWDKIQKAGTALQQSESPDAAVMSHGIPAKIVKDPDDPTMFTADHNYHFFSHAYLTAALMHDQGLSPDEAMHVSGLVGAQYELLPKSLGEGQGNSGIKDILMNSEGAAFGADSMLGDPPLPSQFDGPDVENRHLPDVADKALPDEVMKVLEDAGDPKWDLAFRYWQWSNEEMVESTPAWAPLPIYSC
jgi:hypothetical protein